MPGPVVRVAHLLVGRPVKPDAHAQNATRSASPSANAATGPDGSPPEADQPAGAWPRDPRRYQIIGEHGRGGLGCVFRAHDRDLGRDVAIKELLSRGGLHEVRFLREALITARLEHPGIVPVHEAGRWPDGTPFYAMKLVAGRPLSKLIAERATADERITLLHHVIAVADAIAYAHGRNIIHRDLKPANVIVGDFGETIVIDWGLAKDLSTSEEAASGGGPFRTQHDNDLTSAGDVLGTPNYMAPEQKRGELVDQRADVFAIGAMLWELCAVRKALPTERHLRQRWLRRAGIDQDLITIIDKALSPEPSRRYADAGAMVADLKAFKAGARIAARRYSLLAMLAHWIRRHRGLAVSTTAVIALAVVGGVWSFRNIAAQRDRADAALARTEATRRDLGVEHADLTLKHAELLLVTDPSAAVDTLATYHGSERLRADQLRAEALGRGTALVRAAPHTKLVDWVGATADAVVSQSWDGTITRTARDGRSVVLAEGVVASGGSYVASRGLRVYACDPDAVCFLDLLHGGPIVMPPELRGLGLAFLQLSPSGTQLAVSAETGLLQFFDVTAPARPVERLRMRRDGRPYPLFVDDDTVVLMADKGFTLVRLRGGTQDFVFPPGWDPEGVWDLDTRDHQIVKVTSGGEAAVIELGSLRETAHIKLCHDQITGVLFIPGRRAVAYTCNEGTLGTWDLQRQVVTPRARNAARPSLLTVSADGNYVFASQRETVIVLDLQTGLVTPYAGHRFALSAISPPAPGAPFFASADSRGNIRAWPLPSRIARASGDLGTPPYWAMYDDRLDAILVASDTRGLDAFSPARQTHFPESRVLLQPEIARSDHGERYATFGPLTDSVELWSAAPVSRTRIVSHHGGVSGVVLIDATGEVITSGRDGRLLSWSAADQPRVVAQFALGITHLVRAAAADAIVASTADGALWRVGDDGRVQALRAGGSKLSFLLAIPQTRAIAVGYDNGEAIVIDVPSWTITTLFRASNAIRDIAATPDGRTIAIAGNDDTIHVGVLQGDRWTAPAITWTVLTARARQLTLTPDGLLVAICNDGIVWLYSTTRRTWSCLSTSVDLDLLVSNADGSVATAFDVEGRAIWIDLQRARTAMSSPGNPE